MPGFQRVWEHTISQVMEPRRSRQLQDQLSRDWRSGRYLVAKFMKAVDSVNSAWQWKRTIKQPLARHYLLTDNDFEVCFHAVKWWVVLRLSVGMSRKIGSQNKEWREAAGSGNPYILVRHAVWQNALTMRNHVIIRQGYHLACSSVRSTHRACLKQALFDRWQSRFAAFSNAPATGLLRGVKSKRH